MARQDLAHCNCPICGMSGAHVREAEGKGGKPGKAYIVCEECNCQIFARGPESDKLIRGAMRQVIEGAAVREPARLEVSGFKEVEVVTATPEGPEPVKPEGWKGSGLNEVVTETPERPEDITIFDLFGKWPKKPAGGAA